MCARRKSTAKQLVDFATSFYTDLEMDGMLHAVFIRSPVSHGCIKSVTHPQLPDGYFLITARDIPGLKNVSVLKTKVPVFVNGTVSYQGEPLGMLVGPDKARLEQLLNQVVIRFKQLEPLKNQTPPLAEEVNKDDSSKVAPQVLESETTETEDDGVQTMDSNDVFQSDDILARKIVCSGEDAELILAEADMPVEGNYSSVISPVSCGEAVGGLAVYKQNMLTLYSPVKWFSQVRKTISDVLDIDAQQVVIKKTLSAGNDSSNVWYSVVVMAQLALAAKVCGKPVKLVFSHDEQRLFVERGMQVAVNHRTAVSPDGRILALAVSIVLDAGFYNPFVNEIIDRLVITAAGIYRPAVYKIEAYVVRSSSAPVPVNLPRVDSQVFFAVESQLQRLSERTGLLPNEIRLRNFNVDVPAPFEFKLDCMEQVFDAAIHMSDFSRKYASYKLDSTGRLSSSELTFSIPVRGIGFASAFEGCGFLGSDYYTSSLNMRVTMEIDGSVVIHSYPPSVSIKAIWIRVVASMLEVPVEHVRIDSDFDISAEPKYPNGFFGNIGVMTQLLRKCCSAIQRQRFRHPLPISVSRGVTRQQKKLWDSDNFCGTPFYSTASGVAVVEVELDPCTFRPNVRGVWVAVDGGEILAPQYATMSVKTAVRQVLASLVEGDAFEAARLEVHFIKSSTESKQIGGLVYTLLPAAFAAAMSQAFGREICELPVQPDLIYQPVVGDCNSERCNVEKEDSE